MDNDTAQKTTTDPDEQALEALAGQLLGGQASQEWGPNQAPQHQDGYNPLAEMAKEQNQTAPTDTKGEEETPPGDNDPAQAAADAPAADPNDTEFENQRKSEYKKQLKALDKQDFDDMDSDLLNRFKKRKPTSEYLQESEGLEESESEARLKKFDADARHRITEIKETAKQLKRAEIKVKEDFAIFDDKTEGNKAYNPTLHDLASRMDRQYRSLTPDETTGEPFEANDPYGIYKGINDAFEMGLKEGRKSGFHHGQQKKAESMSQIKTQPSAATPDPKKAASGSRSVSENLLLQALKEDSEENRYGIAALK